MILHKRRSVSKSVSMFRNQHSHALVLSLISSFLFLYSKSLVWRRQFKENNKNANSQPQPNIRTRRHPRRSGLRFLKRRRRVSPPADENHHKDELVAAVAAMMAMTVMMMTTTTVVVVRLVRDHRGSVCGVLLFKRDCELALRGCIDALNVSHELLPPPPRRPKFLVGSKRARTKKAAVQTGHCCPSRDSEVSEEHGLAPAKAPICARRTCRRPHVVPLIHVR
jgi:hypothetical protein